MINCKMEEDELKNLIEIFYTKVLKDERNFSKPFHRVNLDHHVTKQVQFLSNKYEGGDKKLFNMHKLFAKNFMTESGSEIWIELMKESLDESNFSLKKELIERINLEMEKYGYQFNFKASKL